MTNELAIRIITGDVLGTTEQTQEAITMAVKALLLPAAQPEGRSGVFIPDITVEMFRNASLEGVEDFMTSGEMEDISLPSAQPERPKGHWIIDGHHIQCSVCAERMCNTDREGDKIPRNFCPNCGSDNRGEQDDDK